MRNIIGRNTSRVHIQTARQFAFIPTLGISWGGFCRWKFSICFMWLNIQARIGFGDNLVKPLKSKKYDGLRTDLYIVDEWATR